jgi:hypothetical protein
MLFSPYVVSGNTFLGAGVEYNPKGFRFAAFQGRFVRAVRQDTLAQITPQPAFRRTGWGVKIGVGSRKNYFDIMLFKAKDDSTAIDEISPENRLRPQENLVGGISSRVSFLKRMAWTTDIASSLITNDLASEKAFDNPVMDRLGNLFTPRTSTQMLFAGQTAIQYASRRLTLRIRARQVDPDYRSFGAFYQQTDLRSITIDPTIRFKKNKFRLNRKKNKILRSNVCIRNSTIKIFKNNS